MNPNSNITSWLLEEKDPVIRYLAMKDLFSNLFTVTEIEEQYKCAMNHPWIQTCLSLQNADGSWNDPDKFYTDKYHGTVWNVLILAELHADPNHPQIKKACEFLLQKSFEPKSGGFSIAYSPKYGTGLPSEVCPCLTGNMVFALIRLGYLDDERIQKAIDYLVRYQRADDGVYLTPLPQEVAYLSACFGKHSCFMGVVKALKGLSEIPYDRRSPSIHEKIRELAEFLLKHEIYKKSRQRNEISKPGWLKFGFPLMYQTDVLEIMDLFTTLHIHDSRLKDSVTLIRSKRVEGLWKLENTFNGKLLADFESKGNPSKWITYKALRVLNEYEIDFS